MIVDGKEKTEPINLEDQPPRCLKCYDCGYVMEEDSEYLTVCDCGACNSL